MGETKNIDDETMQFILNFYIFRSLKMTEFKASAVAFEVQKSFANKFLGNKTVAKTLIDDSSSHLLDNLYLLLYVFVSIKQPHSLHSLLVNSPITDQ